MVDDARYRTKDYLETFFSALSYRLTTNLTLDDNSTLAKYIVAFGNPDYPMVKVFKDKGVDVVFSILPPTSTARLGHDQYAIGYDEEVPIEIWCIDKRFVTGTKLKWKAEAELRKIVEENPLGSWRNLGSARPNDKNFGSTILHGVRVPLFYRRDLT